MRRQIALVFLLFLLLLSLAGNAPQVSSEGVLSLNPTSGMPGTTVTLTGTGFYWGNYVYWDRVAVDSGLGFCYHAGNVNYDPSASPIKCSFTIPSSASPGLHRVQIFWYDNTGYSGKWAYADFDVISNTTLTTNQSSSPTIKVSPTSGPVGTTVAVTGTGFNTDAQVYFSYTSDINDGGENVGLCPTSTSGAISCKFSVPSDAQPGQHIVLATTHNTIQGLISATALFTVTSATSTTSTTTSTTSKTTSSTSPTSTTRTTSTTNTISPVAHCLIPAGFQLKLVGVRTIPSSVDYVNTVLNTDTLFIDGTFIGPSAASIIPAGCQYTLLVTLTVTITGADGIPYQYGAPSSSPFTSIPVTWVTLQPPVPPTQRPLGLWQAVATATIVQSDAAGTVDLPTVVSEPLPFIVESATPTGSIQVTGQDNKPLNIQTYGTITGNIQGSLTFTAGNGLPTLAFNVTGQAGTSGYVTLAIPKAPPSVGFGLTPAVIVNGVRLPFTSTSIPATGGTGVAALFWEDATTYYIRLQVHFSTDMIVVEFSSATTTSTTSQITHAESTSHASTTSRPSDGDQALAVLVVIVVSVFALAALVRVRTRLFGTTKTAPSTLDSGRNVGFCTVCGAQLTASQAFCENCGSKVNR